MTSKTAQLKRADFFSSFLLLLQGDWKAARSAAALFAPHRLLQTPVDMQNYYWRLQVTYLQNPLQSAALQTLDS